MEPYKSAFKRQKCYSSINKLKNLLTDMVLTKDKALGQALFGEVNECLNELIAESSQIGGDFSALS